MGNAILNALRVVGLVISDMFKEDGSTILKVAIVVVTLFFALLLLILIPVVIHERVPVTMSKEQAVWYWQAAKEVTEMTESPCDPGVYVDWQEVIAVDTVRLKQNFKKSSPKRAKELALLFVEEDGECKH